MTNLLWRSGVRMGQRLDGRPRVARERFEDVLAGPPEVAGHPCQRVGLDFEPSMLDIPWVGSSLRAHASERRGVDPTAAAWWRAGLTATEVLLCQRITGLDALRLGYAPQPVRPRLIGLLGAGATLALQSDLTAALTIQRTWRVGPALRPRLRS